MRLLLFCQQVSGQLSNPQDQFCQRREPTSTSCPLTFTHKPWRACTQIHSKCNLFILRKEKKLLVQKVNDVVGYFSCQRENKVTDIYMNVLKIYFWKRISKFVLSLCYLLSFLTAITFNSSTHFKVKNNLFQSWSIMCPLQWCISKP